MHASEFLLQLISSLVIQIYPVDHIVSFESTTWGDDSSRWYTLETTQKSTVVELEWGRFDGEVGSDDHILLIASKNQAGSWAWRHYRVTGNIGRVTKNGALAPIAPPLPAANGSLPHTLNVPAWTQNADTFKRVPNTGSSNSQDRLKATYENTAQRITLTMKNNAICDFTWFPDKHNTEAESHSIRMNCESPSK